VSCLLRLAFIFDGLSGCGFSHLQAIAFYSLPTGPNSGVHLTPWFAIGLHVDNDPQIEAEGRSLGYRVALVGEDDAGWRAMSRAIFGGVT